MLVLELAVVFVVQLVAVVFVVQLVVVHVDIINCWWSGSLDAV